MALTTSWCRSLKGKVLLENIASWVILRFSAYQELNIALEASFSSSHSGVSVKKTKCVEVSRRQLGWLMNQACPSDVDEFHARSLLVAHDFIDLIFPHSINFIEEG